jgi:hypothetical protein
MAIFIIAAVFIGYHASQESHEVAEGHNELIELKVLSQVKQESYMKSELKESIQ